MTAAWSLWRREQYQYFPFVIAAFGYLLVTRFRAAAPRRGADRSRLVGAVT